jgi:hypothetical protein
MATSTDNLQPLGRFGIRFMRLADFGIVRIVVSSFGIGVEMQKLYEVKLKFFFLFFK